MSGGAQALARHTADGEPEAPPVMDERKTVLVVDDAPDIRALLEAQLRQARKIEAMGHLTGGVAHDFNNILTSVLGYVGMAREHVESRCDERLERYLERAQRSGKRARDLIQQMLTFSRGQQGERRPLRLEQVVGEAVNLLESMVPASISVETGFDADLPDVVADPVHVQQILVHEYGGHVHNHVIELAADGFACGRCYLDLRSAAHDMEWLGAGYYDDEYVKTLAGWKFQSRRFHAVRMDELPAALTRS